MSRTIKIWKDPYHEGFSTCRKKEVTFEPGLTVLVGCNGAGKSTMLSNLKEELEKNKIPVFFYDNEEEKHNSIGIATQMCSSEGENISLNLRKIVKNGRTFITAGKIDDEASRFMRLFADKEEEDVTSNERWILLDAMDSGFSIDNVIGMKNLFSFVLDDAKKLGKDMYIIISSNEYELVDESNCMDVMEGNYRQFSDYNDYKKFILHSRQKKDKRYKWKIKHRTNNERKRRT